MNISYQEEQTACSQYSPDTRVWFKYIEMDKGDIFSIDDKMVKHMLFFLSGVVKVRYNEFSDTVFNAGEMIFLPQSADCSGEALTKCSFIVHIYDAPVRLCDRGGLNSIIGHSQCVQYEFVSLPIHGLLNNYLLLLKSYLTEGVNCRHMHEIKQTELFLILRALYTTDELAQLFFPILGASMDFRGMVMAHYPDARTARELAYICRYSEGHFNKLFLAEFGEPPYRWMQKQKSKHIIGRLHQSDVSLKEIADEFNFTSQSHFNRYCKTLFGESASQLRQKLASGNPEFDR